jgi:hypothetical protein
MSDEKWPAVIRFPEDLLSQKNTLLRLSIPMYGEHNAGNGQVLPAPILHRQHKIPVKHVTVTPGYTPREDTGDARCARCAPIKMKWKGRDEKIRK